MAGGWGGARPNAGRKAIAKHTGATAPRQFAQAKASVMAPGDMIRVIEAAQQAGRSRGLAYRAPDASNNPFRVAQHPKGATPQSHRHRMAMDENISWASGEWAGGIVGINSAEGLEFPGYAYLAELAQRPEYRIFSETIATECTRKWIKFKATGDDDKSDQIKAIEDELDRLEVRDRFSTMVSHDGFFGRSHLYLDFGTDLDSKSDELRFSIGNGRNSLSKGKIGRASLKRLTTVEPVWCYPTTYNAQNPLKESWYNPQVWYVMGTEIHVSRILPFIGRPVPDLLKPAYSFGGLSLSQMAKPYVDIWLKTRQSIGDLIHSFSVMVLMTDLAKLLQPGGSNDAYTRAMMFNALRDNAGLMMVNKNTEDFKNVSAPIGGLHELQAQAQEHMASVARIPLVKFTGISPTGLNASSEGEMRAFYDTISAFQTKFMRPNLTKVIDFVQLSLFGQIDAEITYEFVPLWELTEKERGDIRKSDAETGQTYIDSGVISPAEERARLAGDPESPYNGLDPEDVPDLAEEEAEGLQPKGGKAPGESDDSSGEERGGANDAVLPFSDLAGDDFVESEHPRKSGGGKGGGQFTAGGGGGKGPASSGKFKAPQLGLSSPASFQFSGGGSAPPAPPKPLDVDKLKKVGGQKGSNPGGVYEGEGGKQFYIKAGKSEAHVRNEKIAAKLYRMAGTPTLRYRDAGPGHIATELAKLDKDRAGDLSPEERREAQKDFAVHAWLGNWDAVGLGGDNLGTIKGVPTALDLGGALEYRAMGSPKGKAFGESVGELDTLRDKAKNADAAGVFGGMTPAQMRKSARYVTRLPSSQIKAAVKDLGGSPELADKLIARRDDIAERAALFGADKNPEQATSAVVFPAGASLPVKELNGVKFEAWDPPEEWATVEGQDPTLEEPPFEPKKGTRAASGVVVREPDGRVWAIQPSGGYGGYEGAFPKGGVERGLSLQANAIKEAWEETGLKVKITGFVGDRESETSHTRFYLAERVGGDPSQHSDETEGVVLAPPDKAAGFLTRNRDRAVLAQGAAHDELPAELVDIAEDDWQESKHPRVSSGENAGQFTSGGGSGSGAAAKAKSGASPTEWAKGQKQAPYGGLYKTGSASAKANHAETVGWVLTKPHQIGGHYRRMLAHLIKEAPKFGTEGFVDQLKDKLASAYGDTAYHLAAKSDKAFGLDPAKSAEYAKLGAEALKKAQALGWKGTAPGLLKPLSSSAPAPAAKPIEKPAPAPAPAAPSSKPAPQATPDEIAKAKKTTPFYGQATSAEGQKLIAKWNDQYAGKEISDPAKLNQKVADYKATAAAIKKADEAWAAATQSQKQAAAIAAATAQQAAEQAEAKANAEKNAHYKKELGITDQEAEGFDALVSMMSSHSKNGGKDLVTQFKAYENEAKQYGYPISGFQAALIRNYTNGGYASINEALRSGSWTLKQQVYVKMVNQALKAMPAYTGTCNRGANLTPDQQKRYKSGHVTLEDGFTSSSASTGFGGNTKFTIKAIGKRCAHVKKLSNHSSEDEVVFCAHTFFKVTKVEGSPGGQMHVHMEEFEHDL